MLRQCIQQGHSLQFVAAGVESLLLHNLALIDGLLDRTYHQVGSQTFYKFITIDQRLGKIVSCIYMYKRERYLSGIEGLVCQISEDNGVLASREQYARLFKLCGHLSQDEYGLGLKFV